MNRTLGVDSEGFSYTPHESWSFLHDDGRSDGNTTLLGEYTGSKMGTTSVAATDAAAGLEISFTGMVQGDIKDPDANGRLDDIPVRCFRT